MGKKIRLLVITHTFPTKYNPVAAIFLLNQLIGFHQDAKVIEGIINAVKMITERYFFIIILCYSLEPDSSIIVWIASTIESR